MDLLRQLLQISSPSGNELPMRDFILDYVRKQMHTYRTQPEIYYGDEFRNGLVLVFGKPRTAVFAHMDTVGFMVRYGTQVIPIGSPTTKDGWHLKGTDPEHPVKALLQVKGEDEDDEESEEGLAYVADITLDRGTELVFSPELRETDESIQCAYLDNRGGIWNALKLAETLENGMLIFGGWEEHRGGSAMVLARWMYERYGVRQALISDLTYVTEGIHHNEGAVISIRDSGIPSRAFVKHIINLSKDSGVPFQLEVEEIGGSDGTELQRTPYPIDWCFIGAPCDHMHSPNEIAMKKDLQAMNSLYRYLMEKL